MGVFLCLEVVGDGRVGVLHSLLGSNRLAGMHSKDYHHHSLFR